MRELENILDQLKTLLNSIALFLFDLVVQLISDA